MLTQERAEQVAKSLNAVLYTYEAEVVPDSLDCGYCVTVYEKDPELAIMCIFDDGEVLYQPQQAVMVIEEWDNEARSWLTNVIAAEVYAEREAKEGNGLQQA